MTRRDLQFQARDKGRPWDSGRNFAYSAPLAAIRTAADVGHLATAPIRLTVNGATKQDADVADLIWDCAETIAYVSRFERRVPGDVIDVRIEGLPPLRVTIGEKEADFA